MSETKTPTARMRMTPATVARICERVADGESLRSICRDDGMPNKSTVLRWLARSEAFRDQYAHAREAQADALVEEILEIADDARNDWVARQVGDAEVMVVDQEHIQRSKLRVDARKWIAARLAPKKYGDKAALELSGKDGAPIEVRAMREGLEKLTPEQRAQIRAVLEGASADGR